MSEQAPIQAIRLILGQEYPGLRCHNIDVSLSDAQNQSDTDRLVQALLEELLVPSKQTSVALRGSHRWIEEFYNVKAEQEVEHLKQNGAYLILGGLGDFGMTIASSLAYSYKARIALVDNRKISGEALHSQKSSIKMLQNEGSEIKVFCTDVTDSMSLEKTITSVTNEWGKIDGVIFAVGNKQELVSLNETTKENIAVEFGPRVHGLLSLDQVLRDIDVGFCLVVSSLSTVLGGIGHTAYAASNLFLDAFVRERNQSACDRWTSVNWETWQLGNMDKEDFGIGRQRLQLAMDELETFKSFKHFLTYKNAPQVLISSGNLHARLDQWINFELSQHPDANTDEEQNDARSRPSLPNPYVAPRNELEKQLAKIFSETLGISPIGIHDNFFGLGGDSLLAVQAVANVRKHLSHDVALRTLLEKQTVAELSEELQPTEIDQLTMEETEALLAEIENLSPEEVSALLMGETNEDG